MELEDGRKYKVFDVSYKEDKNIDSTVEPGIYYLCLKIHYILDVKMDML